MSVTPKGIHAAELDLLNRAGAQFVVLGKPNHWVLAAERAGGSLGTLQKARGGEREFSTLDAAMNLLFREGIERFIVRITGS